MPLKPQVNNSARFATAPNFYTVRSGDTLSGIAARYGLSYLSIAEMNDIAALSYLCRAVYRLKKR